jgi:hypothetical protein
MKKLKIKIYKTVILQLYHMGVKLGPSLKEGPRQMVPEISCTMM